MHDIIALWCHPRSVSSAMERTMLERGDYTVLHEPFLYLYYVGDRKRAMPHFTPDPQRPTSYEGIKRSVYDAARESPVFFKDMSYYVVDHLSEDEAFLCGVRSTFLIRDPARSIASYYKLDPRLTREEVGLEHQWIHFQLLVEKTGRTPTVIDAEDLQMHPEKTMRAYCRALGIRFIPEAMTWHASLPESWKDVAGWHDDVGASKRISQRAGNRPDLDAAPHLRDFYEHHRPFYEKLRAYRLEICSDGQ